MSDEIEVLEIGLGRMLVKGLAAPPLEAHLHAMLIKHGVVYLHKAGGGHDGWIASGEPEGDPESPETITIVRVVRGSPTDGVLTFVPRKPVTEGPARLPPFDRLPYAPGPELEAALAELERLDRGASPAPWFEGDEGIAARVRVPFAEAQPPQDFTSPDSECEFFGEKVLVRVAYTSAPPREKDTAAIIGARNALPRLIATIRALNDELNER